MAINQNKKQLIVVVGAGVAGLAVALLAKHKGYDVSVYESTPTYGGKMGILKLGGAVFDTGPSLATDVKVIDKLYTDCGLNPREYWNYVKLPEITRYFWQDDKHYIMPAGIANIEKSLAHTFDTDPVLLHNYLYKLKKSYSKSISYFVDKPVSIRSFSSLNALVSFGLIAPLMIQDLHRRNNRYLRDKKLVQLFDRYATYSGSNPYLTPALSILASGPEVIGGAYYPVGGMRSIADGLYQAGNDLGVKFNFNKPVKSIVQVSSRVEAVVTKKGVIKTNKVIYDGDARMLSVMLKKKPKPAKPSSMSTSAFAFYWVVKGDFKQFGLHNILFSDDYQKEYQQLSAGMISQDPTVFINITSKLEPGLTATGTENWFVMVNVPAGVGEHLLDKVRQSVLQKVFNVTGKKPIIIAEDYLSPKKLEQNTGAYSGAIYGQSANNLFLTIKKPSNKTNIKGLYRVGGTSHPGGGVPLAVRSATIVSKWL